MGQIVTETIYIKDEDYCTNLGEDICSDNKIDKNATIIWKLGNELYIDINKNKYIIDKKEVNGIKLYIKKDDNSTKVNK